MGGSVNRRGTGFFRNVLPPAAVLVGTLLALEAYVRLSGVRAYLLPRPSAVLKSLVDDAAELYPALAQTTAAALIGFAASAAVGVAMAVALSASRLLRRAVYPYTVFFQTVPLVAIAPLLIFVLDPGLVSVSVCAFVVSVFPVIANTLSGLLSTDPALVDLFRLYQAGAIARFWKLRLPAALPGIFTGLRIAAGLSVIGTVVAELLVGSLGEHAGLGVRIVSGIKYGRIDRVFAAVLLSSLLGLLMFGAVNAAARLTLRRWHASEQD
jgi:NitT/TauT family transport system permease protein